MSSVFAVFCRMPRINCDIQPSAMRNRIMLIPPRRGRRGGVWLFADGGLFGVEVDELVEGALADGAECFAGVGAHAAVVGGSEHAFFAVTGAFVEAYAFYLRLYHILPLGAEIHLICDVFLPRFYFWTVYFGVAVLVFVGESAEAVAELMHYHGAEVAMVCCGECVVVVDASAAIFVGVGEDDEVFVHHTGYCVVHFLEACGGEVAVAIECAEV